MDAVRKSIFEHLDSGKNGKITKEDLEKAATVLLKMDEDQTRWSCRAVLVAYDPASNNSLNGLIAGGLGGRGEVATSNPNLVLKLGEVPVDLVKRLKERYGKDLKADAKGLSITAMGLDEATFKRLDTDGNGVLDDKELAAFAMLAGPRIDVAPGNEGSGAIRC